MNNAAPTRLTNDQTVDVRYELLHEWLARLESLNYSNFTIRGYRLATQRLLAAYPGISLEKFTPEHIERHIA